MTKQILLAISFILWFGGVAQSQCWRTVSVGGSHVLALKSDGTLWAWGSNYYGQLGNGTTHYAPTTKRPIQISADTDWKIICAGYAFSMALKNDGSLWAWGYNGEGQLGNGTTTSILAPTRIGADNDWKTISAGYNHCLALKQNGTLWSWGSNLNGKLGNGSLNSYNFYTPAQVGTATNWKVGITGQDISIALTTQDSLYAWGINSNGLLGVGNTVSTITTPKRVVSAARWRQVDAGRDRIMGIQMDGSLWGWGQNNEGSLGLGSAFATSGPVVTPTRVGTDTDWTAISIGKNAGSAFASKSDQSIWGAGDNRWGQLGDSTLISRMEFKKMMGAPIVQELTRFGGGSTALLRADNSLWMTGDNSWGQLGDNSITARSVFGVVSCGTTAAQEISKTAALSLMPNPVTNALRIQSEDAQECIVKIINMTGQIVLQGVYQTQQWIDIQSLPAGFYTLVANDQPIKFVKN